MARRLLSILLTTAALLVSGELIARFGLGLGDPPVYIAHPTIEYLLAPDQACRPFGNRFEVNRFSMRSEPFEEARESDEIRVMVLGDSVVNGGTLTDQRDLATHRARRELEAHLGRRIVVGNISSGSWGPGNWLAYIDEYGLFDADVAVLVMSTRDAFDVRNFEPLRPARLPTRKPRFALLDGARYVPRYLRRFTSRPRTGGQRRSAIPKLDALLARLSSVGTAVVLLHPQRRELETGEWEAGAEAIRAAVERSGLGLVELDRYYAAGGDELYRDGVHPSARGQHRLGRALVKAVIDSPFGSPRAR